MNRALKGFHPWLLALLVVAAFGCERRLTVGQPLRKANPDTRRTIAQGELVGGDSSFRSHAWLGIPFATPPVGDLRWRAPKPPAPWAGVKQSLTFPNPCPQFGSVLSGISGARDDDVVGSEDCLGLSIWAPPFTPAGIPQGAQRIPVMFWIHGGGNSLGSEATFDGGHLATVGNVIVVTTQYRLGPLGWFRHRGLRADEPGLGQSGNFGTLDLIRGLEWVRDNISAFGGDPGNITIFGESAGGVDVYSLLLSPAAKGLFHRAIIESGGLPTTTADEAEHFTDDPSPGHTNSSNEVLARLLQTDGLAADRAAAKARIAQMSDAEVEQYLRSKSIQQLFAPYKTKKRLGMIDLPAVLHDGAVIPTDNALSLLGRADGWNRVPLIVGTNRDEAKLFLFFDPTLIHLNFGFFPRFVSEDKYQAISEYFTRGWKLGAVDLPAEAIRHSGFEDIWAYRFDWHDEPMKLGADLSKMIGAAHGLEIPFVFGQFDMGSLTDVLFDSRNQAGRRWLSSAMMHYWSSFARTGQPAAAFDAPPWPAWGAVTPQFLVMDIPASGGIRPSTQIETEERLVADFKSDSRLPTDADRCKAISMLAERTSRLARDPNISQLRARCDSMMGNAAK